MLNSEQTNKKQAWKFGLILPVLVIFMLLFQIETIAREKNSKIKSEIKTLRSEMYLIEKSTSDKELNGFTKQFKEEFKIDLNFNKIKRNKKEEITQINISIKNENGKKLNQFISDDEAITPVQIIVKKVGKHYDFEVLEDFPISADKEANVDEMSEEIAADFADVPNVPDVPNMDFDIPSPPDAPNMPDAPSPPSDINDKKAWDKFEKEIKLFEKKVKEMEPEWSKFEADMKVFELKMKEIEPNMKEFEQKMAEFEQKMRLQEQKIEQQVQKKLQKRIH